MKKLSMKKKQNISGWVLLTPAMILIVCLSIYPMVQALFTSFQTGAGANMKWIGLTN